MTITSEPIVISPIETEHGNQEGAIGESHEIRCESYKAAKVLAGSQRREGKDVFAVYNVPLQSWCVR